MARSHDTPAATTQAQLTADHFHTPPSDGEVDRIDLGTPEAADKMDTPVGRSDPAATREALLEAPFGTEVIVAGRGYTVGRQVDDPIIQVLAAPMVRVLERDHPLVVLEDALVPKPAIDDDGHVPDDARIPLAAVYVRDPSDVALADRVAMTSAAVTTSRDCPACGSDATTGFEEDNVDVGFQNRAEHVPDRVVEVRACFECDGTFLRATDAQPDTGTIERTRSLYGVTDEPTEIGGLYTQSETCLFPMMKETNAYRGVWTASEVAAFVNAKLDDSGEDGEKFGFVTVEDGGDRVVWHDDQPYNMEATFKRVDAGVLADDADAAAFDILAGAITPSLTSLEA